MISKIIKNVEEPIGTIVPATYMRALVIMGRCLSLGMAWIRVFVELGIVTVS